MNQNKQLINTFKELPLYLMLCMLVLTAAQTDAGEIEPRYYCNSPVGVNFLLAGYIESFNGKFRDELLNGEIFYTLKEAKVLIEKWRREYNTVRRHISLNYRSPAPEACLN